MLTSADKKFLTETFATKNEFRELVSDVSVLKTGVEVFKNDIADINMSLQLLERTTIRLEKKVDKALVFAHKVFSGSEKMSGRIADLDQENKMGALTLRRHGIQIEELAKATKTKISR